MRPASRSHAPVALLVARALMLPAASLLAAYAALTVMLLWVLPEFLSTIGSQDAGWAPLTQLAYQGLSFAVRHPWGIPGGLTVASVLAVATALHLRTRRPRV